MDLTFGRWLKQRRSVLNLTQEELAQQASCSPATIDKLESGDLAPSTDLARVLARALAVPAAEHDTFITFARTPHATVAGGAFLAAPPDSSTAPIQPVRVIDRIDLLTTKLYIPPPGPPLVPRPRLTERLSAGMACKLILVTAPAGFGKTTALSAWLDGQAEAGATHPFVRRPALAAWVSLDAADNDPARFWRYVITALASLIPGLAEAPIQQLNAPQAIEAILTQILNALAVLSADAVLVLDDYHAISAPAIHDRLTFLLDHLPPRLHVVLASRSEPPLPLARLRGRGQLAELRASDLRFTVDEAAMFLREIMRLPLDADAVTTLEARTEGWIAGLQLAALAMREKRDLTAFLNGFRGNNRFVLDYLVEEVFARQPAHIQQFLLQTSILERMCGALCDAVLGLAASGQQPTSDDFMQTAAPEQRTFGDAYSQIILEDLERRNLFVVPLDDERRWYRYHHLFADVLRARLMGGVSAAEIRALHRRASAWYEQQGLIAEAVQHALAAQDWQQAAHLIEERGLQLSMSGHVHTVLTWLSVFPDEFMQLHPLLCLVHANGLMMTNQLDAAEARVHDAERSLQPDTPDELVRMVQAVVMVVRGLIRSFAGDRVQAISLLQQAVARMPETAANVAIAAMSAVARVAANSLAATAYQLTGNVTAASERRVAEAIGQARGSGSLTTAVIGYTALAHLHVLQGRLRTAATTYAEVERLVPRPEMLYALPGSQAYYFGMGDLLREWNDLDRAADFLALGMELVQAGRVMDADAIKAGYLTLAQLQQAQGNGAAALATLDVFISLAHEREFFPALIEGAAALRARLQLSHGDLLAAFRWAEASELALDDELSFPYESTYLTLARVRVAAGQAEAALPLLKRLLADAETKRRMRSAIEILLVQALAFNALGERSHALFALDRALGLARAEGYIRVFVDEGLAMRDLLHQAAARVSEHAGYITTILAAFPGQAQASPAPPPSTAPGLSLLIEALNERELEVLRLIALGHSNREIADLLVIALSTVKTHINNCYGKLGVHSRTQALARARELGLI